MHPQINSILITVAHRIKTDGVIKIEIESFSVINNSERAIHIFQDRLITVFYT